MKKKDLLFYFMVVVVAITLTDFYINARHTSRNNVESLQKGWHRNPANKITLYSTSWCKACKATKEYLNKKEVKYTNIDIELNTSSNDLLKENGINTVPVITFNEITIVGFNKSKLDILVRKVNSGN